MATNFNLERSIKRIEERISKIATALHIEIREGNIRVEKKEVQKPQETWVKASVIKQVTGWDAKEFQRAKKNNLFRRRITKESGQDYLLESISPMFIKPEYRNLV